MKRQNHTAMPRLMVVRASFAFALAAISMLAIPAASHAQRVAADRVTINVTAEKSVIEKIKDAAKGSKIPTTPAGAVVIPLEIMRKLALNAVYEGLGEWLKNSQLCNAFDKWAVGKKVGDEGTIMIEIILTETGEAPTDASPRIMVPMLVKKTSEGGARAGKGGGGGYMAPKLPNGVPTMKLDLFGDGRYVIERMECPRR